MPPKKGDVKASPLGDAEEPDEEMKEIMERELLIAHLKQKLGRYQALAEGLRDENVRLADELKMQAKNFDEINIHMQSDMQKVQAAKQAAETLVKTTQEDMQKMKEDYERQIEEQRKAEEAERGALQDKIEKVEKDLREVRHFMDEKQKMTEELNEKRALLVTERKQHEEVLLDLERRQMQEKDRLTKEMALKIKETKAQMMKLTDNQLESTTKRTIMENEQMSSELAYQSRQTEKLLQKNQALLTENAAMKRGMELSKQTQGELAKRNHVYQKTIKTLLAKLKAQDATTREMEEEVRKLRESESISQERLEDATGRAQDHGTEVGRLQGEVESLSEQLQLLDDQQDETTKFLLACLEDVKKQIVTVVKEGVLGGEGGSDDDEDGGDGKADVVVLPGRLDELSLEQRERALSYLLEKLHAFQNSKQNRLLGLRAGGGGGGGMMMGMGGGGMGEPSGVLLPPIGGRSLDALYGGESGLMAGGAFRYPYGGGGAPGERAMVTTGVQTSGTELMGLGDISSMVFSEVRPWGKRADALPLTHKGVDTYHSIRKGSGGLGPRAGKF